ncbi:MAG: 2-phospho-L-lactate guanylyltransferase [Acetobacteraceae bacterium]|nr:2-phospho-L-lactate guanylyltransferase [Acetobacteraceae bacterium]
MTGIWAIIPVKELHGAKQRLAGVLTPEERHRLAITMLEEVLAALAGAKNLAGVALVTLDPHATAIARRHGWRVITEGARAGHTGSVDAARHLLAAEGIPGILTLPGDIPATTATEIDTAVAAHGASTNITAHGASTDITAHGAFTIVPAHDELGSNTIIVSPPLAVPLRFGDNSYLPHLAAARAAGLEPKILHLPGIALDIDHPADLASFLRLPQSAGTRTRALLESINITTRLEK